MKKSEEMKDKMIPTKGYFKIEKYDKDDNLIDEYEDFNKIMGDILIELLANEGIKELNRGI